MSLRALISGACMCHMWNGGLSKFMDEAPSPVLPGLHIHEPSLQSASTGCCQVPFFCGGSWEWDADASWCNSISTDCSHLPVAKTVMSLCDWIVGVLVSGWVRQLEVANTQPFFLIFGIIMPCCNIVFAWTCIEPDPKWWHPVNHGCSPWMLGSSIGLCVGSLEHFFVDIKCSGSTSMKWVEPIHFRLYPFPSNPRASTACWTAFTISLLHTCCHGSVMASHLGFCTIVEHVDDANYQSMDRIAWVILCNSMMWQHVTTNTILLVVNYQGNGVNLVYHILQVFHWDLVAFGQKLDVLQSNCCVHHYHWLWYVYSPTRNKK